MPAHDYRFDCGRSHVQDYHMQSTLHDLLTNGLHHIPPDRIADSDITTEQRDGWAYDNLRS